MNRNWDHSWSTTSPLPQMSFQSQSAVTRECPWEMEEGRAVTCGDHQVFQRWLFCWPGRKPLDPRASEQSHSFFLNSSVSVQLPSQEPVLGHGLKHYRPGNLWSLGPHSDWLTSFVLTNSWGSRLWDRTSLDAHFLLRTGPCTDAWSWRLLILKPFLSRTPFLRREPHPWSLCAKTGPGSQHLAGLP